MKSYHTSILSLIAKSFLIVALITDVSADKVETIDGSVLLGKIRSVSNNKLTLATDFAGRLEISMSNVKNFTTEEEVIVRLNNGDTLKARIEQAEEDTLQVKSTSTEFEMRPEEVQTVWMVGERDPAVIAAEEAAQSMQRKWTYEVGADTRGNRGNSKRNSMAGVVEAKLAGPHDELILYGSYEYVKNRGRVSANETIFGIEFTNYFSGKLGWFIRSELEQDEFENIALRSTSSGGLSYRFIKNPTMEWTARGGMGYRFESFDEVDPGEESSVDGISINTGTKFSWQFAEWGKMKTEVTALAPANNFNDVTISQDTALEFPLAISDSWKLQIGIKNDYDNEPDNDLKKLDTTYYSRLLMSFE